LVVKYGRRIGLTEQRLDRVAASVRRGGLLGIGLAVLTPGVRSAVVPACGLSGIAWRLFLPGLALGSVIDLGLHFAIGFAGSSILATIAQPSPLIVVVGLGLLGLAAWLLIGRRRHASTAVAVNAWAQATCPVCLILGSVVPLETEPAVRWSGAV
jgi:membrane protein DedA with SNARE-associated domain